MKDKIKQILVDVYGIDGRHEDEATERILRLFNVVKSLPTDDELDEAAVEYCKSVYSDRPEMDDYQDGVEAFDAGAVWMRERLTGNVLQQVVNSRYLWFTDYIEVPNGTYVDKMGRVKMSYLVRTPQGETYAAPKYDLE